MTRARSFRISYDTFYTYNRVGDDVHCERAMAWKSATMATPITGPLQNCADFAFITPTTMFDNAHTHRSHIYSRHSWWRTMYFLRIIIINFGVVTRTYTCKRYLSYLHLIIYLILFLENLLSGNHWQVKFASFVFPVSRCVDSVVCNVWSYNMFRHQPHNLHHAQGGHRNLGN